MPESKTKGIFLKGYVKAVHDQKGDKGLEELETIFGDLHFSGFADYPFAVEKKLDKAVIRVLWGAETPEAWEKLGRLGFRIYIDNPIGKTMFSLFGGDIKRMAFMISKVFGTVTSGYDIKVEDMGEKKVKITIDNCSDVKEYWTGLFKTAVEYFGFTPSVQDKVLGENYYEYIIAWK